MTERLYHVEIGFPAGFQRPTERVAINYGQHARRESMQDRYGNIPLPKGLRLARFTVIEIGMVGNTVSKILFRGRLDERRDLCIVLIPNGDKPWFCKTVWVNVRTDKHNTLNVAKYERV